MIELFGGTSLCNQNLLWYVVMSLQFRIMEDIMHNLISHNQLAGWKQSVERLKVTLDRSMEESDLINDYYNCLIECDDDQAVCKRICRRILS